MRRLRPGSRKLPPAWRRNAEGLTVLELTVAMALVMLIMAPVLMFVATSQRNQSSLYKSTGAQADARQAVDIVARNLRDAQYPAGTTYASTNSDMFGATPSQDDIVFYSPVDAVQGTAITNNTNGTIYQVEYKLNSSTHTLTQTLTAPSSTCSPACSYPTGASPNVMLTDVLNDDTSTCSNGIASAPLFQFQEQSLATGQLQNVTDLTNDQSQINYVLITVITGPTSGSGTCTEIQSSVSLRNWRP